MRLRTELHERRLAFFDIETVKHDAMAAHALVMALDEYRSERGVVLDRAAEIMASWGYTDET